MLHSTLAILLYLFINDPIATWLYFTTLYYGSTSLHSILSLLNSTLLCYLFHRYMCVYFTPLYSTMALASTLLHSTTALLSSITLYLDSTLYYHRGSTWFYFTVLHSTTAILVSPWLYHTLLYSGSNSLYRITLLISTMALYFHQLHSTLIGYTWFYFTIYTTFYHGYHCVHLILLHTLNNGSTSLCCTVATMALLYSTKFYHDSSWFYLTTCTTFHIGSTWFYFTVLHSIKVLLDSTLLHYFLYFTLHSTLAVLDSTLFYYSTFSHGYTCIYLTLLHPKMALLDSILV